ncbi:hypothetical protein EUGRSUZ_E01041 [Eucalyptus grandis]|uniref:Uncharacterized protein n=2 Tax=Eucalyptus grandis TaxID=71139 RepID=A0ACC3KT36_EUCGR|nr:hypothetical protein EUGRSUZ_E01041 [Eucalyptus grandis]
MVVGLAPFFYSIAKPQRARTHDHGGCDLYCFPLTTIARNRLTQGVWLWAWFHQHSLNLRERERERSFNQ